MLKTFKCISVVCVAVSMLEVLHQLFGLPDAVKAQANPCPCARGLVSSWPDVYSDAGCAMPAESLLVPLREVTFTAQWSGLCSWSLLACCVCVQPDGKVVLALLSVAEAGPWVRLNTLNLRRHGT